MITKTYKLFVEDDFVNDLKSDIERGFFLKETSKYNNPITITMEVEEPTIKITPSELIKVLRNRILNQGVDEKMILDQLFGEGWDE